MGLIACFGKNFWNFPTFPKTLSPLSIVISCVGMIFNVVYYYDWALDAQFFVDLINYTDNIFYYFTGIIYLRLLTIRLNSN